jgi:uncharacterized lipoprotein YmbA
MFRSMIIMLVLLAGCAKAPNVTFLLDPAVTYPEERRVLQAVPVIPVDVEIIAASKPE